MWPTAGVTASNFWLLGQRNSQTLQLLAPAESWNFPGNNYSVVQAEQISITNIFMPSLC